MSPAVDTTRPRDLMRHACAALFAPGQVVELRVLGIGGRANHPASGWFDDWDKLATCAANIETHGRPEGIYITLNPVNPACLARSPNELRDYMQVTTSDRDIIRRHWLPIDIDPVRPSGVSSTEEELQAAREVARSVRDWLENTLHFPEGIRAASGNGIHLLYRIDLPNDDASTALVKDCLAAIDRKFSGEAIKVDRSNINPSRIFKLYGTMARKGASTSDRPHRRSKLFYSGALPTFETVGIVPADRLKALAVFGREATSTAARPAGSGGGSGRKTRTSRAAAPAQPKGLDGRYAIDLDAFVAEHQIAYTRKEPFDGTGWRYILTHCVFDPSHVGTSAALGRSNTGRIFYKCQHDSCAAKTWDHVKEHFARQAPPPDRIVGLRPGQDPPPRPSKSDGPAEDNPWALAQAMIEEEFTDPDTGYVTLRRHRQQWYKYNDRRRHYALLVDDDIDVAVTRWLGAQGIEKVTCRKRADVVNSLGAIVTVPHDFDPPFASRIDPETGCSTADPTRRNWVTVKNGILDIDAILAGLSVDKFLRPHTPEWFSLSSLPFPFPLTVEEAACPTWITFLEQIFQDINGEPDAQRIALLQEAFGYSFMPARSLEVFFVLHGTGRNGKSTVLNVLRTLLGEENVASLSMEQLAIDHYLIQLQNKLANLCADMNELDRVQEGIMRAVVSGDLVSARRLYKDPIQFRPKCSLWFATNVLPRFQDTTGATWRRLKLIPFDYVVPPDEIDVYLFNKLEAEMAGILYWSLQGMLRIQEHKAFTRSARCEQAAREFRKDCFPILLFLDECTQTAGSIMAGSLWNTYRKWCEYNGLKKPKPLHPFVKDVLGFRPHIKFDRMPGSMEHRMTLYGLSVREGVCLDGATTPAVQNVIGNVQEELI